MRCAGEFLLIGFVLLQYETGADHHRSERVVIAFQTLNGRLEFLQWKEVTR